MARKDVENTGHGHVFPRADGVKFRCGGPRMCGLCAADLAEKERAAAKPTLGTDEITDIKEAMDRRAKAVDAAVDHYHKQGEDAVSAWDLTQILQIVRAQQNTVHSLARLVLAKL